MSLTKDQKDQNNQLFDSLKEKVSSFNVDRENEDESNGLLIIGTSQKEPDSEGAPDASIVVLVNGTNWSLINALRRAFSKDEELKQIFQEALEDEIVEDEDDGDGLSKNEKFANDCIVQLNEKFTANGDDSLLIIGRINDELCIGLKGSDIGLAMALSTGMLRESVIENVIGSAHEAFQKGKEKFGEDYVKNIRKNMSVAEKIS